MPAVTGPPLAALADPIPGWFFAQVLLGAILCGAVLILLTRPRWAIGVFLLSLPFEVIVESDLASVPKVTGLIAFLSWSVRRMGTNRGFWWPPAATWMTLFLAWAGLSVTWSDLPTTSLESMGTYAQLLLVFIILATPESSRDSSFWLKCLAAAGLICVVGAGDAALSRDILSGTVRVGGLQVNPNALASWSLVFLPGVVWVGSRAPGRGPQMGWSLLGGALVVMVFLSGSRGGLIALAIFLAYSAFRLALAPRLWVPMLLALVVGYFVTKNLQFARWQAVLDPALWGESTLDRFNTLWPAGLKAAVDHPFLGSGIGTNPLVLGQGLGSVQSVHSAPLAVMIETGLPGVGLYLTFVLSLLWGAWSREPDPKGRRAEFWVAETALLGGLLAYLVIWGKGGGAEYGKALWVLGGLLVGWRRVQSVPTGEVVLGAGNDRGPTRSLLDGNPEDADGGPNRTMGPQCDLGVR